MLSCSRTIYWKSTLLHCIAFISCQRSVDCIYEKDNIFRIEMLETEIICQLIYKNYVLGANIIKTLASSGQKLFAWLLDKNIHNLTCDYRVWVRINHRQYVKAYPIQIWAQMFHLQGALSQLCCLPLVFSKRTFYQMSFFISLVLITSMDK